MKLNDIFFNNSPFSSFVAHLEQVNNYRIDGELYHIQISENGFEYYHKEDLASALHPEKCENSRLMFSFIFQNYCGDWEGRLEFPDSEYWSTELSEMNDCWNLLEEKLKELILNNGK